MSAKAVRAPDRVIGERTHVTPESIVLAVFAGALLLAAAWLLAPFSVLLKIVWQNKARLEALDAESRSAQDPQRGRALAAVHTHCMELKRRWMLKESDLAISGNSRAYLESIAAACHPESAAPLAEVQLGSLLDACDELKQRAFALSRLRGIGRVTQFRLRHVQFCIRAWQKKQALMQSRAGRLAERYRVWFWLQGFYALFRFFDVTFWVFKSVGTLAHHVVFKALLIRWYLSVGELAVRVYSESAEEANVDAETLLEELDAVPAQQDAGPLPAGVQEIAIASRKTIWFDSKSLDAAKIWAVYSELVRRIAAHHHPESREPLYEVKLHSLLLGIARLSEDVAALRDKPVLSRLLKIRLAQAMRVKRTADQFLESELWGWLKKYQVPRVMKYATLLFKAVKKKHPGILFKDVAFFLVKEGTKRWAVIYLHDRIVREADLTYREASDPPPA